MTYFESKGLDAEKLKRDYDQTLKDIYIAHYGKDYADDFPWSPEYPLYFQKGLVLYLTQCMRPEVLDAYVNGEGGELTPSPWQGRPPKFASIASSSRFCFLSLEMFSDTKEGEGADFFARPGGHIETMEFEKRLPVTHVRGKEPSMDAYAFDGEREYFFECKCHEMFDGHSLELSKQYFKTGLDLVANHIPDEFLKEKDGKLFFDPRAFGDGDTLFDVKQLLTHLMGIVCNRKTRECDLIYFYCLPKKEDIKDERLNEVIEKAIGDAIKTFESPIIKDYCKTHRIRLRLFAKDAAALFDSASKDNTEELY